MVSQRQREIYDFIVAYARKHGYPPTVREIGAEVGLASPSTVHVHLAKLEQAGYVRRDPTKPRALELVGRDAPRPQGGGNVHVLPLIGEIAAGAPLLAEQNIQDYVSVPEPLARGDDEFLLRVRGDSMIEAGIMPGDYVVVRRQQTADTGDVVAALVGDDESAVEATVKTFYRENGRVRLQPENSALEPLYPEHVQILGKVVGLFRRL
jgi:repressor LexA